MEEMKNKVQDLIGKIDWEGDIVYVAENWPDMFEDVGLGAQVQAFRSAFITLDQALDALATQYGVNF